MYTVEYTAYVSGGFGYNMDIYHCEENFSSFMELLWFLSDYINSKRDCDYIKVVSVYTGCYEYSKEELEHIYNVLDGKFVPSWDIDNDNNIMFHATKTTWLKPDGTEHIW